jgi:phage shock protein E
MKAAILPGFGQALSIEDAPMPLPRVDEVPIQVEACGVCHSDLHVADGDQPTQGSDEDTLLIDVRTSAEYASGYVEGALNLPLERFVQEYESMAPDKLRQIVLYCRSGARSEQAALYLRQQNYENVVNGGSVGAVALKSGRSIRRL